MFERNSSKNSLAITNHPLPIPVLIPKNSREARVLRNLVEFEEIWPATLQISTKKYHKSSKWKEVNIYRETHIQKYQGPTF